MKWSFLFLILGFSLNAFGTLTIPKNLNSTDRERVTEILGLSSASKILGNPFPLGGYSGIEVGYSFEVIATTEISQLGNGSDRTSEVSYGQLTLGKGLYNNLDVYLHFTPFSQGLDITGYGGQIRWGFYQAEYLPAHLTMIAYANTMSFENMITTNTTGLDLVAGFSVEDVTLYTGIGMTRSIGTFLGGADGITDSGSTTQADLTESHYLAGINIRLAKTFVAFQLDRYTQATYSAKFGTRF